METAEICRLHARETVKGVLFLRRDPATSRGATCEKVL